MARELERLQKRRDAQRDLLDVVLKVVAAAILEKNEGGDETI
jgi:hypothetical protein